MLRNKPSPINDILIGEGVFVMLRHSDILL